MIKVSNTVQVYEIDEAEIKGTDNPQISINSHWNDNDKVILYIDDHKLSSDMIKITLVGRDLIAAITNAMNTRRF